MRITSLLLLGFFCSATPALASENGEENVNERPWSVGFSGGVSIVEDASDQTFAHFSVSRDFGESYAGLALTLVDSGEIDGLINAVPASTTEFTFSAGTAVGAVSLDGYVSYGKRDFDTETVGRNNGQMGQIDSDGELFGVGASISYDHVLNDTLFLTPSLAIDYNEIDISDQARKMVILASEQRLQCETESTSYTVFIAFEQD